MKTNLNDPIIPTQVQSDINYNAWETIIELDLSVPKVVIRWHKMWKCAISVWYSNTDPMFRWHEKTLTTKWPEEAFEPFYMEELPHPPLNQQ